MDKADYAFAIVVTCLIYVIVRFCTWLYFEPTRYEIRIIPNNNIKFADIPLQEN